MFSFYVLHFSLDWCNGFTLTVEGDMLDMDGVCLIASAVQRLSIKSVFGEVLHSCSYVDKAGMSLSLEAAGICDALLYHTINKTFFIGSNL